MPTPRQRAREFFHAVMGRVPGSSAIKALGDELDRAEARGRQEVLVLVCEHFGPKGCALVTEKLAETFRVPALDRVAQPADDVADQYGATAPAGRG